MELSPPDGVLDGRMAVKLMLLDDHPLFREGLRALLSTQPDFQIVGERFIDFSGVPDAVIDCTFKNAYPTF